MKEKAKRFKLVTGLILVISLSVLLVSCSSEEDNPVYELPEPTVYLNGALSFSGWTLTWSGFPPIPQLVKELDFDADGGILDITTGAIPTGEVEVAGGTHIPAEATSLLICYGGVLNQDETVDITVVAVTKAGNSVTAGTYAIGTESMFIYIKGAEDFLFPPTVVSLEGLISWAQALVAERVLFSVPVTVALLPDPEIVITNINGTQVSGTFSGPMSGTPEGTSISAIYSVDDGVFTGSTVEF